MFLEKINFIFKNACVEYVAQKGAFTYKTNVGKEIQVLNPILRLVNAPKISVLDEVPEVVTFYDWDEKTRKAVGSYNLPANVLFDGFGHKIFDNVKALYAELMPKYIAVKKAYDSEVKRLTDEFNANEKLICEYYSCPAAYISDFSQEL